MPEPMMPSPRIATFGFAMVSLILTIDVNEIGPRCADASKPAQILNDGAHSALSAKEASVEIASTHRTLRYHRRKRAPIRAAPGNIRVCPPRRHSDKRVLRLDSEANPRTTAKTTAENDCSETPQSSGHRFPYRRGANPPGGERRS